MEDDTAPVEDLEENIQEAVTDSKTEETSIPKKRRKVSL